MGVMSPTSLTPARPAIGRFVPTLLLLLTVFGPISMDLYLPVLPALTVELDAATSIAQLTVTACLIGLALGQLIAGPLSDRLGRRIPLLVGLVAYVVTSVLCAVSPAIETLILARVVQGLAGGVGIVIAQAAGRDLYSGGALIRFYGRLTVLAGLAAIVGPLIGGMLATVADWRGLFLFLAGIGAAILLATLLGFRETLPASRRTSGGFRQTGRDFRVLLSDRIFVGAVLVTGLANAAVFAYLAGATFVLQGIYGYSPQQYAVAFGLNSAGFMVFGFLAARTAERWSIRGTLVVGIAMCALGAGGLLLAGLTPVPVVVVNASLFIMVSGVAVTTPPTTTLALAEYPQIAGTASSLLGMARFAFGAIAAPLVGIAGAASILPLGLVTTMSIAFAALAYATLIARPPRDAAAAHGSTAVSGRGDPLTETHPTRTTRRRHHAWSHHARPRRRPRRRPSQPGHHRIHRRDHPHHRVLHLRLRPLAVPRHGRSGSHPHGSRIRRGRHRDRRRCPSSSRRRLRCGLVLRLGQHLRDLPGGLPIALCARHRTGRHPGRVRAHPVRRRNPRRNPWPARRRPHSVTARRIRCARNGLVRRRRR